MTHVHFIGISGSGLSAIAHVLLESGYVVSGSDRTPTAFADELSRKGASVFSGHAAENIAGADLVVRSSAVPDDNVEVIAARKAGIPVLKRSEFLQQVLDGHFVIAVAGTHGKTTTTAMAAWALSQAHQDPSYIIGGVSKDLGSNAHASKGSTFVIEADEYDHMFLGLNPDVILLTYLEHDHPDCFPTPEDYRREFVKFIHLLKPGGLLLVNADHAPTASLLADAPQNCRAFGFGVTENADYRAISLQPQRGGGLAFDLVFQAEGKRETLGSFKVSLPGDHNLRNALAVMAMAHQMKLPLAEIGKALASFSGTGRRFDILGEAHGITIINDYAHHPTEIKATLQAARARFTQNRIWAVWQPHTFSRTRTLLADFAAAFSDADRVIVTEIYAAREKDPGYSSARVVEAMQHPAVHFSPTLEDASQTLLDNLQPGDVVLILSAGDAEAISHTVLTALQKKENANA